MCIVFEIFLSLKIYITITGRGVEYDLLHSGMERPLPKMHCKCRDMNPIIGYIVMNT